MGTIIHVANPAAESVLNNLRSGRSGDGDGTNRTTRLLARLGYAAMCDLVLSLAGAVIEAEMLVPASKHEHRNEETTDSETAR